MGKDAFILAFCQAKYAHNQTDLTMPPKSLGTNTVAKFLDLHIGSKTHERRFQTSNPSMNKDTILDSFN
jgi:hypothetical protein